MAALLLALAACSPTTQRAAQETAVDMALECVVAVAFGGGCLPVPH